MSLQEVVNNFTPIPFNFNSTTQQIRLSEVYTTQCREDINVFFLFVAYFNSIPNKTEYENINCSAAVKYFLNEYKPAIIDFNYTKISRDKPRGAEFEKFYLVFNHNVIVYFDITHSTVKILFKDSNISKVDEIVRIVQNFKQKKIKDNPYIFVLVMTSAGFNTRALSITKPSLNISDNYNDDFYTVHKTILKRLSKSNDKGLVLLHGKPGTGKTSYIRYLIGSVKKRIIFLPPNMAGNITNPSLISILIENPNSIFVIEDAEKIVIDRETDGNSPVAAILNISDGLLADCLNIQIICSFNTDISKIDSALMRAGRLIAKYEFKELHVEKAQHLSNKLGFHTNIETPMTVASIYNQA